MSLLANRRGRLDTCQPSLSAPGPNAQGRAWIAPQRRGGVIWSHCLCVSQQELTSDSYEIQHRKPKGRNDLNLQWHTWRPWGGYCSCPPGSGLSPACTKAAARQQGSPAWTPSRCRVRYYCQGPEIQAYCFYKGRRCSGVQVHVTLNPKVPVVLLKSWGPSAKNRPYPCTFPLSEWCNDI